MRNRSAPHTALTHANYSRTDGQRSSLQKTLIKERISAAAVDRQFHGWETHGRESQRRAKVHTVLLHTVLMCAAANEGHGTKWAATKEEEAGQSQEELARATAPSPLTNLYP